MDVNYVDECEQNIYENDANESTSQVSTITTLWTCQNMIFYLSKDK